MQAIVLHDSVVSPSWRGAGVHVISRGCDRVLSPLRKWGKERVGERERGEGGGGRRGVGWVRVTFRGWGKVWSMTSVLGLGQEISRRLRKSENGNENASLAHVVCWFGCSLISLRSWEERER